MDGPALGDCGAALCGRNTAWVAGGVLAGKPLDGRGLGGAVTMDLIDDGVSSSNGKIIEGLG